jgi:capsular exopolysaccharide synthesis family protein
VNVQLPQTRSDDALPVKDNGGGALGYPDYPRLLLGREDAQDDLRSRILSYLFLLIKHKYLVAAIVSLFLFAGVIVTLQMQKIYSAVTTIKIDAYVPQVFKSQSAPTEQMSEDTLDTQYELIRSRALAERVATTLQLAQSDFVRDPPRSLFQRLLGRGQKEEPPIPDAQDMEARREAAVGQIMGGLSVQPVGRSAIVRITYLSPSPAWAQRISNSVADEFVKMTLDMRFSASKYARNFLQEQLDAQKLKLEDSEKQVIDYAQKEGIVDVDNKQPQVIAELQTVQNALSNAVTNRLALEETWHQANADDGNSLPQVMADGLIQSERTKLAELRANYQDKLATLKPAFPEMMALQNQISQMEADIRTQVGRIKSSISDQHQAAVANEKALADKVSQLKAEALDLRSRSVKYTILAREADTNRSLYDGLLQQYRELGVTSDAQSNNVSVVDKAQLPFAPVSPKLYFNLLVALVLGVTSATGAIWFIELLDDTFKSAEDLEERLGLPVLGVIPFYRDPEGKKSAIAEVTNDLSSPLAESYRSLRTAIQFSTAEGAPRALLVTSARAGEGKTTNAISLAINFAQLGMRVLLIDADLRNPSVHRALNLENSAGLSNCLSGAQLSADSFLGDPELGLLKQASISNISVLTSGPLPPNPAELLAGSKLGLLLTTAAECFDIAIIDGPPIMGLADVPILSSVVDGTVIVVESGKTRRALVRDALKRLHFARARVLGIVLSKYQAKHGSAYGYGYGYGYGYKGGTEKYIYRQGSKPALGGPQHEA